MTFMLEVSLKTSLNATFIVLMKFIISIITSKKAFHFGSLSFYFE
jgi:hypothetical protein